MRFFGAADGLAYTSWLLGVKEESEGQEPLESSSVMRCHARAQRSGLNSKNGAGTHSLQRSGSKIRPPAGLIGAAQHPRMERRAIIPATLVSDSTGETLIAVARAVAAQIGSSFTHIQP
jgi:hypothetical protein